MTQNSCERCGQCCLHGGPALHGRDKKLLEDGTIERKHLITYLAGELLKDPVSGTVIPLESEIVKLKMAPGSSACIFYVNESNSCTIYAKRPAECRAQKCWDPEKLLAMYESDRLERGHLVSADAAMAELIREHGERCGRKRIQQLSRKVGTDGKAAQELEEMLKYDEALRDLVAEKASIPRDLLDLYFGRPVALILPTFGLKARLVGGRYAITRIEEGEEQ